MDIQNDHRFKDLANKKFGRLTVIEYVTRTTHNGFLWKCQCDCGNIVMKRRNYITAAKNPSCGKHKTFRLSKGNSGLNQLIDRYKRGAKNRGLVFELKLEEFKMIVESKCYYCGDNPSQISSLYRGAQETVENSKFIYNGIDRKDNHVGYITENVVPCCSICNRAKSDMSYLDFINYINRFKNK